MSFLDNKENKEPSLKCDGKEIQTHKITSQMDLLLAELKTIQNKIEIIQKENERRDQCIRTCLQDKTADREAITENITALKELERNILKHTEELLVSKKESQRNVSLIANVDNKWLKLSQVFERMKDVIEEHIKNETNSLKKYDNVQNQLAELTVKYETLKNQSNEGFEGIHIDGHEHDAYKKEISKFESNLKRLEIKTRSLETALKQKSEECSALSALYEDIAGGPINN